MRLGQARQRGTNRALVSPMIAASDRAFTPTPTDPKKGNHGSEKLNLDALSYGVSQHHRDDENLTLRAFFANGIKGEPVKATGEIFGPKKRIRGSQVVDTCNPPGDNSSWQC